MPHTPMHEVPLQNALKDIEPKGFEKRLRTADTDRMMAPVKPLSPWQVDELRALVKEEPVAFDYLPRARLLDADADAESPEIAALAAQLRALEEEGSSPSFTDRIQDKLEKIIKVLGGTVYGDGRTFDSDSADLKRLLEESGAGIPDEEKLRVLEELARQLSGTSVPPEEQRAIENAFPKYPEVIERGPDFFDFRSQRLRDDDEERALFVDEPLPSRDTTRLYRALARDLGAQPPPTRDRFPGGALNDL